MQSLHHLLTYVVHDIDYMLRYLLSIYLSSISINVSIQTQRKASTVSNVERRFYHVPSTECWEFMVAINPTMQKKLKNKRKGLIKRGQFPFEDFGSDEGNDQSYQH